jgi:hypothetical protein
MFAVTWPPASRSFARAVLDATNKRIELALYNFESHEVCIPIRAGRLRPGTYRARAGIGTRFTLRR